VRLERAPDAHVAGVCVAELSRIESARNLIPRLVVARNHRRVPPKALLERIPYSMTVRESAREGPRFGFTRSKSCRTFARPVRGRSNSIGVGRIYLSLAAGLRRLFQKNAICTAEVSSPRSERPSGGASFLRERGPILIARSTNLRPKS